MGLLARALIAGEFKLGIYKARQITRIERGGLVISCADSRYQPGNGIRYEMSPDEWFLHIYRFFPRYHVLEAYDEDFLAREVYYDYFAESGLESPRSRNTDSYTRIFAIFKNDHDTGYRLIETSFSESCGSYRESRGSYYSGLHINSWGTSDYRKVDSHHMIKPFEEAKTPADAAIYMLSDAEDFIKVKIDLSELIQDCETSPGSCQLHTKLTRLLKDCRYQHLYLQGN